MKHWTQCQRRSPVHFYESTSVPHEGKKFNLNYSDVWGKQHTQNESNPDSVTVQICKGCGCDKLKKNKTKTSWGTTRKCTGP